MAYILSIETATTTCSVAIHNNNNLLACQSLHFDKSHSGYLAILIKEIVNNCGLSMSDLDAIAISGGPGSYTGLRIGTSTAKGLAYSLQIPLISVNTLEALARQIPIYGDILLCPMLDARRMEVYNMLLKSDYSVIQSTEAIVINESSYDDYLKENLIVFFGSGANKTREVIKNKNANFIIDIFPSASSIGDIAYQKFINQLFEDVAYYEPFYLKDFMPSKPKAS